MLPFTTAAAREAQCRAQQHRPRVRASGPLCLPLRPVRGEQALRVFPPAPRARRPSFPRAGAHGRGKAVLRASHDVDAGCIQPPGHHLPPQRAPPTAARGLFLPRRERAGVGSGHELSKFRAALAALPASDAALRARTATLVATSKRSATVIGTPASP